MQELSIQASTGVPRNRQQVEIVERKGLGHPDTICDLLMESLSVALCAEYRKIAGRVLHHNLDKGLLVAGQTSPAPGGGTVAAPMRIIFGDRATDEWQGTKIPIGDIVETTATRWIRENLRFVDPGKHVAFQNEIRPGSPELVDIFARRKITANDTSAAVGYAPLSETERLVLAAERLLNSQEFKTRHPETGEDIKVMGVRRNRTLQLTVAIAFVDRFIADTRAYFARKLEIEQELIQHFHPQLRDLDELKVQINTLDDPARGTGGMYLTVLGTSAEGADGGEVGRGNRVNGIISLNRPLTMEAAAGKNPVSHVGKIYNVLGHQIAARIHASFDGIEEVSVWLCSQIGRSLDDPWMVSIELVLASGIDLRDVADGVRQLVQKELGEVDAFVERLCQGEFAVC
jgi:S-adenosylmethionine synthetase